MAFFGLIKARERPRTEKKKIEGKWKTKNKPVEREANKQK